MSQESEKTYTSSRTWTCKTVTGGQRASLRQEALKGWDQAHYESCTVNVVGAGGIGGEVIEGLAQKGMGTIHVSDPDTVAVTDLNRQKVTDAQVFKNKAKSVCHTVSQRGFLGSTLVAHPVVGQDVDLDSVQPHVIFVGVDLKFPGTRLHFCGEAWRRNIPLVVSAVSADASLGYVFVQEGQGACWACALKPEQQTASAAVCPGVPAAIDILKVMAGISLYAIDTVLMARPRDWNYRMLSLSMGDFGRGSWIRRRKDCPVCGQAKP